MSDRPHPRLRALLLLFVAVPLAGVLIAGLVSPWIVGSGLVARSSADLLTPLPSALGDSVLPGNTVVLAADGSVLTYFYRENRTPVSSGRIAPVMKQALVDIEDARFYSHHGIDLEGTARALVSNLIAGGVREGGSTLTQQLVKQTLLQTAETAEDRQAATEQSIGRKLREARLALAMEEQYTKDEILTRYLNLVYFGEGAYGVEAAARRYFGVAAADLDVLQAATLAGLVQTPTADNPVTDPVRATVRRNARILKRRGAVKIVAYESGTSYALGSATGDTRVAWTSLQQGLVIVQCVSVRRGGSALAGRSVTLLRISAPIDRQGSC